MNMIRNTLCRIVATIIPIRCKNFLNKSSNNEANKRMFGCEICQATPNKGACGDDLPFIYTKELHFSSHSSFLLCKCRYCKQPYLHQFHEIIDWHGGHDDIFMRWVPLTDEDVVKLKKLVSPGDYGSSAWNELYRYMLIRRRLVQQPNGVFFWSDNEFDVCDMMPPG